MAQAWRRIGNLRHPCGGAPPKLNARMHVPEHAIQIAAGMVAPSWVRRADDPIAP